MVIGALLIALGITYIVKWFKEEKENDKDE